MSNLDFTQDEIIQNILEDIQEFQREDNLSFLQAISKVMVEYDRLIRHSEENEKNIFLTLKILCNLENTVHENVENRLKKIKYEFKDLKTILDKVEYQSPPPAIV